MAKDKCVLCGKETPYDKETHVDMRRGYIEGCGQTCPGGCYTDADIYAVIEKLLDEEAEYLLDTESNDTPDNDLPGSDLPDAYTLEDGRTGYELFRYVKPEEPQRPQNWEINLFWFITGLVTSAIVVFIVYKLSKMLAL